MPLRPALPAFLRKLRRASTNTAPGLEPPTVAADEPLRAELYSADQMAVHGRRLAAAHELSVEPLGDRLLARLASNERVLVGLGKQLASTPDDERRYTPAVEWLLDNFYLIEEEIRTARRHLPRGYSRELPRLAPMPANGVAAGQPRVYDLALQAIAHGDGQIGRGQLTRFLAAYQSVQPLQIGELWAFPIMLRLALIENLRRVATHVAQSHAERSIAGTWAARMLAVAEKAPSRLIPVIADMARTDPALTNAFVSEFARRLQGQGAAVALPLTWMEQRLDESGHSIEQQVQLDAQQQAANQVSVSNSIGSLRLLGAMDWREFVETLSGVEQTLREDPAGAYGRMDFATRDRYRHVVEEIAKLAPQSESEVASAALALARAAHGALAAPSNDGREAHVGHYLVGAGRDALERSVGVRLPRLEVFMRAAGRRPLPIYASAIVVVTLGLAAGPLVDALRRLQAPWWIDLLLGLIVVVATSQLAVSLINWLVTLVVAPQPLPRMDYLSCIAPESRTLIVVPTMLGNVHGIDAMVDALEVRFLANRDPNLFFGLLTDFHDAETEHLPGDAALVDLAAARIEALNRKYRRASDSARTDTFFLFHRPRRWNPREQAWMGYERKRGKLADLNALLRGHAGNRAGEPFAHVVGDTQPLSAVRYVITLDADTQLPRDAASQIVATMAHPLNRPRFGSAGRNHDVVVDGYGILQPRVGLSLPSTNRSGYARLYGGEPGIDPYTRAVSDVYQDLFGEGSFIGKGIYDVDAFERALAGRLPENRILSHDLLEGCYARAGLLSDVQLLEESPTRYSADVARRYRWIRGDWQLVGWLRRRLHAMPGRPLNPLSMLGRAKIFDNLRRSLVPSALLLMLIAGWFMLADPDEWTLRVLAIIALVPLAAQLPDWVNRALQRRGAEQRPAALPVLRQAFALPLQIAQTFACLPHEAAYSVTAIARTVWRVLVSGRRLLEWRPSADIAPTTPPGSLADLLQSTRTMAFGPLLAIACAAGLATLRPGALVPAAPVLLLWLLSPVLVWWIDRPLRPRRHVLSAEQTIFLRRHARRTWAFFDTHVGAEDNHLPPDNVQEQPVARVAHRTSPTNIGFSLLATLTARQFGYLTGGALLGRLEATLQTMESMERYRGHFFNWYDTRTLEPLRPRYISTVDSGNLAGQLLTLRAGLMALGDEPLLPGVWCEGLRDSYEVLVESLGELAKARRGALADALGHFDQALKRHCAERPGTLQAWHAMLDECRSAAAAIESTVPAEPPVASPEAAEGAADPSARWARLLVEQCDDAAAEIEALVRAGSGALDTGDLPSLRATAATEPGGQAAARLATSADLAARFGALAEMDFTFLYDAPRHLMTIGYSVDERRVDAGYYDLLASEARLGIFVAIAQRQIAQEAWFSLGRLLTSAAGEPVLLSWSGSMFEYLMPALLMPSYPSTLLEQTCVGAVRRQIQYGAQRGVPWGISESGYNATDTALNYQYRAFGVPGLGLKRGLAEDLVIAPYASVMALIVAPEEACANLQRLADEGAVGPYGFYEAIDYTASRLPRGHRSAIVRSFMAHHQGMGLLALAHLLLDRPLQRWFESDPQLQATLLLLQERIPRVTVFHPDIDERAGPRTVVASGQSSIRLIKEPDTLSPEVQLLSNGRYHVMVTQAGGGYSRWRDFGVTRWHEDTTRDAWGSFCYLRDVGSGAVWSTTYQPTRARPDAYEAIFSAGRAEFRRRDAGLDTHTEIVVSPEDDIELRRVRITNNSRNTRTIEVTSYAEVVLANPVADALHPAFSKLFVQTEILEQPAAILCTRRPRSPHEQTPCMVHLMAVHRTRMPGSEAMQTSAISHETDRALFIGRGRSVEAPQALDRPQALSNSAGSVLDPVAASRCTVTLAPDQAVTIDLVYGIGANRAACVALAEKYQDRRLADRVFELAWTHAQVVLRQLNASEGDAQLYGRLAGPVIYAHAALRAEQHVLLRNHRGQSGLWGYAISGDLPIVLLQIGSVDNIDLVRQLVQAHAWWRLKGLAVDLVIWNQERDIYRQRLQEQIMGLIAGGTEAHVVDRPGGIFVRHVEQIAHEDRVLLLSVARAVFNDARGSLAEQVKHRPMRERRVAATTTPRRVERRVGSFTPTRPRTGAAEPSAPGAGRAAHREQALDNGIGGFSPDGREYIIAPPAGKRPPAPWVNVLANPRFGTVVSEAGGSYTWCENAHELRLTPWHNDPVEDTSGEAIYLRDEETGQVWSPTSLPCLPGDPGPAGFVTRHRFGSSVFEHTAHGIRAELEVYVAPDAAVKFSVLRLHNESGRPRRLSATGYVEWVLGDLRSRTAPYIVTEVSSSNGALCARNPYSNDYGDWIGFFDADGAVHPARSFTCDRAEFIGRNGSPGAPAALSRTRLAGKVGAALDPCAAIQVPVDLPVGGSDEVVFRLGMARGTGEADELVLRFRGREAAADALATVQRYWRETLGTVQVRTPDPAVDVLANGWLLYQTIGCRIWARSGYYQSGGAFGFRDQLQDAMALVHSRPEMLRAQLLLSASRQFVEGDVQHWWHPPQGRGVRTRISDDYLWLPLALARYVESTGDRAVLDELVPFLEGRPVNPPDDSYYDLPSQSPESASLYEHATRALWHGLRFGAHGLPLMGTGDWNDGMNLVGEQGRGESVWLGFFLCEVLARFGALAWRLGDETSATRCDTERAGLASRLEAHGWDGEWFRRAYFDDGSPLGSAANAECRIDSIAQSWSVLSGAAPIEKATRAMASLKTYLVRPDAGLVQLLDPPFDQRGPNPGYIAGYVPGVRENGGQYTHAAIWAAMAFAALGDHENAWSVARLINPVTHGTSPAAVETYKVEPYVVTADVYSVAPHTGRGGWSWYTGSAGWMYRLIIESLLGLHLETTADDARLVVAPCLPDDWPGCTIDYRYRETLYTIEIRRSEDGGPTGISVDGVAQTEAAVPLRDDRQVHRVEVRIAPVPKVPSKAS